MYWDKATEEEKKKRAKERRSHYIHVVSLDRRRGTVGERGRKVPGTGSRPTKMEGTQADGRSCCVHAFL